MLVALSVASFYKPQNMWARKGWCRRRYYYLLFVVVVDTVLGSWRTLLSRVANDRTGIYGTSIP